MHILLGKKQVVLAALVAALGLAVFVNWYYTGSDTEIFPEGSGPDSGISADSPDGEAQLVGNTDENEYFASVRLQRDNAHASAIEDLQTVLASAAEESNAAVSTAKAIEEMSNVIKMEADIESLVTGKTGSECVAVISENSVEVLVPTATLSDSNVLTISDVINEVCNGRYENIKISGAVG
ncbi:MAG: SpoIIIAH-like family protein [Clostridia bacterium]|nr:SpoIIIAH-like family protein [Clostridia bacterium]